MSVVVLGATSSTGSNHAVVACGLPKAEVDTRRAEAVTVHFLRITVSRPRRLFLRLQASRDFCGQNAAGKSNRPLVTETAAWYHAAKGISRNPTIGARRGMSEGAARSESRGRPDHRPGWSHPADWSVFAFNPCFPTACTERGRQQRSFLHHADQDGSGESRVWTPEAAKSGRGHQPCRDGRTARVRSLLKQPAGKLCNQAGGMTWEGP